MSSAATRGFGLIEVMVGLIIGMIATIIMFQTFEVSERQKRTTTGAADAQNNGAISTFTMERDIKMAGWGLDGSKFASCSTFYTYHDSKGGAIDNLATSGASLVASVLVTDGGTNPDSVTIQYYENPSNANVNFAVTRLAKSMPSSSAMLFLESTYGCAVGDLAIVSQGANCMLIRVTQIADSGPDKDGLQHNSGANGDYNPPANYQNQNSWPEFNCGTSGGPQSQKCDPSSPNAATVQCFRDLWRRTYTVANAHELQMTEPDGAGGSSTFQIAPEIINMQAEYGIADVGSQQVTSWVPATGNWSEANLTITRIKQIKAIRIALLARSATYEKPDASGNCSATTADNVDSWPHWNNAAVFATSQLPSDYACYRYKTYEIKIPLRNIIWART